MIADIVPECNEHLELILFLLEYTDFIFSPEITTDETFFLKQLIKEHHDYFLQLCPHRNLKPKHHFMTHYPQQIRLLGSLINYWTMRFEAKHRFFKRLGHIVCNYQNILKTLAVRQQMFLCYNLMCGKELVDRDIEIGPGSSTLVASLERAEFLSCALGVHLFSEIYVAKWCVVNGIKYARNVLIITGKSDALPIFQEIILITCDGNYIKLVTALWEFVKYERHTHSYVVTQSAEPIWSIIPMDNINHRQAYHASNSYREEDRLNYVTIRHRI